MAQSHWLLDAHDAESAVLVVVQIRPANAAKGDSGADLPCT